MKLLTFHLSKLFFSVPVFCFLILTFLFSNAGITQSFQRNFGNNLDNSFTKVIQDGTNYYVLGSNESIVGGTRQATVSRLDANGMLQWTLSLTIGSVWNDAVLTPNGELLVVGSTLPFGSNSESIMGRVKNNGTFGSFDWLRQYNSPGRDFLYRIVKNPVPEFNSFPYYVIGAQLEPGASPTVEDVILFNIDSDGNFAWKKSYPNTGDDEFFRDFEALAGTGDLLMGGNSASGLIFRADNTGNMFGGAQISQVVFTDLGQRATGGFYASAISFSTNEAFIMKLDNDLILQWDVKIPQLTAVSQVWEGPAGAIFVTGRGSFGGTVRTVIIKLIDNGPTISWVKYLNVGSGFLNGSLWNLPSGDMAYTDERIIPGGFGGTCAFISVSDMELNTCMVSEDMASLIFIDPIPDGPLLPFIEFQDTPMGIDLMEIAQLTWQEAEVCSNGPCEASFSITLLNSCGFVQVSGTSTGPSPFTYQWCDGQSTPAFTTQLACGTHTFCVSVTCADGTMSTASQTITIADNIPPTAICVPGFGVELDANCSFIVTPEMIDGGSTDNCQIQSMSVNPSVINGCGVFPVTLTVTDWCGNVSTCTTSIQTIETVPPTITCPPNLTLHCDDDTSPNVTGFATATDNCDPNPVITYSDMTFGLFPCDGLIQRTWTATDDCGNESTCIQNILVIDNIAPMITCPQDVTVTAASSQPCSTIVNGLQWFSATDNCGVASITYIITGSTSASGTGDASGQVFQQGISTVTYTVTDDCGNTANCSFMVTVECTPQTSLFGCGQAVISCFSGFLPGTTNANPNGPVIAIIDVRDHDAAPLGVNWPAVSSSSSLQGGIYHDPNWSSQMMGQVFGVTIDNNFNIYASSTTIYGKFLPANLTNADFGNVYMINSTTGQPNIFATLPQDLNNPAGLGDVWFDDDPSNAQVFVSNFHDGLIYRYDMNGVFKDTYDFPGVSIGTPSAGFIARGERVWAVATYGNKLYFSVWNEDRSRQLPAMANQVWSVQLDGNRKPIVNTHVLEKNMPDLLTYSYSSPVSDISFSETGLMLVAERSMNNDYGDASFAAGSQAHASRIMELSGPAWGSEKIVYVGNTTNHVNSSGGIDYGYDSFDPTVSSLPMLCDSMIWGTGDALRFPGQNTFPDLSNLNCGGGIGDYVYGLAGMPQHGNSNLPFPASNYVNNSSIYIDIDNNLCSGEKVQIGDVDIFKNCISCPDGPDFPCDPDSIMVTYAPASIPGTGTCCYDVGIKSFANNVTQICANLTTPGWIFNTGAIVSGGFTWTNIGSTQLCIDFQGGNIPNGTFQNVLTFCLAETTPNAPSVQQIIFDWYQGSTIVCQDTMMTDCEVPITKDTCLVISNLQTECLENDLEYCMTFNVTNPNATPAYGLVLGSLPPGYAYGDCGCGGSPYGSGGYLFSGFPLIPANSTQPFCVKIITAAPILSPTSICFNASFEFIEECCSSTEDWCVVLNPCCTPCENTFVEVTEQDSCCYSIDLNYDCDFGYYTHIDFDILTPGVSFGWHSNDPTWNVCALPTLNHVCIEPPVGTVQPGNYSNLFNFCLTDINMPTEIPQQLQITYWTIGSSGQDSIACDTILTFNCEYKKDTCVFVTNEIIECIPDSMKYQITLTVQNLSVPNFTASSLGILGPGITPNPIPLNPPLDNDGSTRTVSFCYTPNPWPDADNLLILSYRLKNFSLDTCCNGNQTFIDTLMLPPCDTCICGDFSEMTYRPTQGIMDIPVSCGDTMAILCDQDFSPLVGGTFLCQGTNCPLVNTLNWTLSNPDGSGSQSGLTTGPNFTIPLTPGWFTTAGLYTLTITGNCGGQYCPPCVFYIESPGCLCCEDYDVFCENIENAVTVSVDNDIFKATLNLNNLPDCNQIESINWGDNQQDIGPFPPGSMPMHVYTNSGSYTISWVVTEIDDSGNICFEKTLNTTISFFDNMLCDNNFVPNPSFESYSFCPTSSLQFPTLQWSSPSAASPDYYNSCATALSGVSVPANGFGNQAANTGAGYVGIIIRPINNAREYIEVQLTAPLVAGYSYKVSFFVSLADEAQHAADKIGAYLSVGSVGPVLLYSVLPYTPQVINPAGNFITDKNNWTLISGTVVAVGGEDHIVIGNFSDNNSSPIITGLGGLYPGSYYWIDDVSVCATCDMPPCDTCYCGDFSDVFVRWGGAPSQQLVCDGDAVLLGCPQPGSSFEFTGAFQCAGDDCPDDAPVSWDLVHLQNNTVVSGSTSANPYFGISILPAHYSAPGTYELRLFGTCGSDICTCVITFTVDCPDPCPCEIEDILALDAAVNSGFAQTVYLNSCKACFSPLGLSDCETVDWYIGNTGNPSIGTSTGNQTICHTFSGSGNYTVVMVVTRLKPDGTICEVFTKSQTVNITCSPWPDCDNSVFANPRFSEGAVAGGLDSGGTGMSDNWTAVSGTPVVVEGAAGSLDGWTIDLSNYADTSDVLTTFEPICLEKGAGMLTLQFGIKEKGIKSSISFQLYGGEYAEIGDSNGNWNPIRCLRLAQIDLTPMDTGEWAVLQIPYDLSDWPALDTCGNFQGVLVRPAIFVNHHSTGSATNPTARRTYVQLDNFCFDGTIVAVSEPVKNRAISLFPNPTTGNFTLQFESTIPKNSQVQILDLWGQIVRMESLVFGEQQHKLSIDDLPSGLFFIKVLKDGQAIWTEKVIKQ